MLRGKILLDGGPCSGKTSSLNGIKGQLSELGYKALVVDEAATWLISRGIKPFGDNAINVVDFQRLVLNYQIVMEKMMYDASCGMNGDYVIVCDRGMLDGKYFVSDEEFKSLLNEFGKQELSVLDDYDLAIVLATTADGADDFYTLDNNMARTENAQDALKQDLALRRMYCKHDNVKIVGNYATFDEKMQAIRGIVSNFLGDFNRVREQKKFLVKIGNQKMESLLSTCNMVDMTNIYLDNNELEERIKVRMVDGVHTYWYTKQMKRDDGLADIKLERRILEQDFRKLLEQRQVRGTIHKKRYTFVVDKQVYRLDCYDDGMCILEVDVTCLDNGMQGLELFDDYVEVTGDRRYLNGNLAKKRVLAR